MANIQLLKHRINAARNVSKTTKALQMISASKLKRAQNAVIASRPYLQKITEISNNIRKTTKGKFTHPYLEQRNLANKSLLLVLSPDKGLCGSMITNLLKEFAQYQKSAENTSYIVIGKKLEGKIIHLSREIVASFAFGTTLPQFEMVYPLIQIINEYYNTGKVDSVKVLTTEFTNIFTQTPRIVTLLPLLDADESDKELTSTFSLYEPEKAEILNILLKRYLEMAVYQQLIESFVSEQGARMIAMQNASENAGDIIEDLQLEYNKTRQAKITSELLDITGGIQI